MLYMKSDEISILFDYISTLVKKTSWYRLGAVWQHCVTWSGVHPDCPRRDAVGYNELNDTCLFVMAHNDNRLRFMLYIIFYPVPKMFGIVFSGCYCTFWCIRSLIYLLCILIDFVAHDGMHIDIMIKHIVCIFHAIKNTLTLNSTRIINYIH